MIHGSQMPELTCQFRRFDGKSVGCGCVHMGRWSTDTKWQYMGISKFHYVITDKDGDRLRLAFFESGVPTARYEYNGLPAAFMQDFVFEDSCIYFFHPLMARRITKN